ncbi:MAG: HEPN domain-containing protein [Verrucomicrobiota bacterium]
MPPERLLPDDPLEWLNRAKSDLTIAQSHIKGAYLEDLRYHAQQAAEKAFKALLLQRAGKFPYVHDLAKLVSEIELEGMAVPGDIYDAVALTSYAVQGGYPGFDDPVTELELTEARTRAVRVVKWVEALLQREIPKNGAAGKQTPENPAAEL